MAALRYAARRFGGSVLQPTQAAVASPAVPEGQRLFLPRFNQSNTPNQVTNYQRSFTLSEIQQKKEELYDSILKAEDELTFLHGRLIHHLALQVRPRPKDPKWLGIRIVKRLNDAVDVTGRCALALVLNGFYMSWCKCSAEDGKVSSGCEEQA